MATWKELFDGRLVVQPPLSDEQLGEIPAKRGIVLLLAEDDQPIILLSSADLRSKLRNRLQEPPEESGPRKTADLKKITREIRWQLAGSHFENDLIYYRAARALWPRPSDFSEMIAWKPAWFVHVNPEEQFPYFRRTRDVHGSDGHYLGPFPTGKAAERFVASIEDAFDLCQDIQCLRRAPEGQTCAYAQMGKCLSPCDGSVPMERYREQIERALGFARGRRREYEEQLHRQMQEAAKKLEFERAGSIKNRLERMSELDRADYESVRPLEQFRFLMVQSSGSRKRARVFFVHGGAVDCGGDLAMPLEPKALEDMLTRAAEFQSRPGGTDRWLTGLVSRYLFSGGRRRGIVLRWSRDLTAEHLIEAVVRAQEELGLGAVRPVEKEQSAADASAVDSAKPAGQD
ncbi:MAG: UvrB/UvrC motif-containing protein [Phycisphaerae bacterium]